MSQSHGGATTTTRAGTAEVVVVGGGCNGTSIAWQLAKRGAGRVVLVEKRGFAAGGTGRSSAIVRQHYAVEPLARMALHSLRVLERFGEIVGGHSGFRRVGFLALLAEEDLDAVTANVAMQRRVGIDTRVLRPDDIRGLEPRLALDGVGVAAWEPEAGYADPHGTTAGFVGAAKALGVECRVGVSVTGLDIGPDGIRGVVTTSGAIATRTVVVAAGFESAAMLAPYGVVLPLRPMRHTMAIVQRSAGFGAPHPTVSDRIRGSYYRPEGAELTMIGMTDPLEGHDDPEVDVDRPPDHEETARHVDRFLSRFPSEAGAVLRRGYTGVYECTPDFQPILGPVAAIPGLHLAVGFSGHGFKLSPAVGEMVAERIVDGRASLADIGIFSPDRFALGRLIRNPHPYSVRTL